MFIIFQINDYQHLIILIKLDFITFYIPVTKIFNLYKILVQSYFIWKVINMRRKGNPHKSSIGKIDANIMACIAYLGGSILVLLPGLNYFSWVLPLFIYTMEKKSKFVKQNALQSFNLQIINTIIMFFLNMIINSSIKHFSNGNFIFRGFHYGIALIGTMATIVTVIFFAITIIAVINAYNYDTFSLIIFEKISRNIRKKTSKLINHINIFISDTINGKK